MTNLLTGYAVTVLIAMVLLSRWVWRLLLASHQAGAYRGIPTNAFENIYLRLAAQFFVGAIAFVIAFSWPSLVIVWGILRAGAILLRLKYPATRI